MPNAELRTPSFTWESHRRERWTWRNIGALVVVAVGAGFIIGRLSIAAPALTELSVLRTEQKASPLSPAVQRQAGVQPDASATANASTPTAEVPPDAKSGAKEGPVGLSTEAEKMRSAARTEKQPSNPSVVLINPSVTDKASGGSATKQPASTAGPASDADTNAKTEAHKAEASPSTTAGKQPAKARPQARTNASAPPVRPGSVVVRRDDAYVPPHAPQATYPEQRWQYDDAYRDDDRPRFEQRYPDRRYVEEGPPPRASEGYDYRREYVRPYQDLRDPREYRRFGGYDSPYEAERPLLRPMNGRDF